VKEFFRELFRAKLYKANQGRIVRQVTAVALVAVLAVGIYQLHIMLRTGLQNWPGSWVDGINGWLTFFGLGAIGHNLAVEATVRQLTRYGLPIVLMLLSFWVAYRLMNMPSFADFLIAVEAEMNKVSWPTRTELIRSSVVVLVTIFALAAVLYAFDFFWGAVFTWLRIL